MVERRLISLPSQLQLIERLQHLIYLSSSMLLLSGDKGAGKSTITQLLSNALPAEQQQVYLSLNQQMSAEKLRQQIVTQLYANPLFNPDDRLVDTVQRLQAEQQEQRHRLIVIDNAQYLPDTFFVELCELLDAANSSDKNLNILLVGDNQASQHLLAQVDAQLPVSISKRIELLELNVLTLSNQESQTLLQHYFNQVDYQAQLQHQDALNKQITACLGNPKQIIDLAAHLSEGKPNNASVHWLKSTLPSVLLMLVLSAVVAVLGNYLYSVFITDKQVQPDTQEVTLVESKPENVSSEPVIESSAGKETLAANWHTQFEPIKDTKHIVGESDDEGQRVLVSDQQINSLIELPQLAESEAQATDTDESTPLLIIQNERIDEKPLTEFVEPVNTSVAAQSAEVKEKELKPEAEPENKGSSMLTDVKLLKSKAANHYTLQLSGMSSRVTLTNFVKEHQLPQDNVFVYQTIRNNKPWFVVIYGEYDTIRSAQLAAKNLPGSFAKMKSWVKSWKTVHNDLRLINE